MTFYINCLFFKNRLQEILEEIEAARIVLLNQNNTNKIELIRYLLLENDLE